MKRRDLFRVGAAAAALSSIHGLTNDRAEAASLDFAVDVHFSGLMGIIPDYRPDATSTLGPTDILLHNCHQSKIVQDVHIPLLRVPKKAIKNGVTGTDDDHGHYTWNLLNKELRIVVANAADRVVECIRDVMRPSVNPYDLHKYCPIGSEWRDLIWVADFDLIYKKDANRPKVPNQHRRQFYKDTIVASRIALSKGLLVGGVPSVSYPYALISWDFNNQNQADAIYYRQILTDTVRFLSVPALEIALELREFNANGNETPATVTIGLKATDPIAKLAPIYVENLSENPLASDFVNHFRGLSEFHVGYTIPPAPKDFFLCKELKPEYRQTSRLLKQGYGKWEPEFPVYCPPGVL
jgi:hypothetical protein